MKPITLIQDNTSSQNLYEQLYLALKVQMTQGQISYREKLPSVRNLASELGVSVTTINTAYNQLLDEGYIESKAGSGYFCILSESGKAPSVPSSSDAKTPQSKPDSSDNTTDLLFDPLSFDFTKWKKCSAEVLNDYSHLLLSEAHPQGEAALRHEISEYLLHSRGLLAGKENIVIAAGTSQIATILGKILKSAGIGLIAMETPCYAPVHRTFEQEGFTIADTPLSSDGVQIEKLPTNFPCACYVSPSNQFPTGVVMPASRRYELLNWAVANHSYIIEDDYNSELRYLGKPLPALKSLDEANHHVVYLGSFSSTLFPAIKISYMVLPDELKNYLKAVLDKVTQTCSKTEQLTLALFMQKGFYYSAIRSKRKLYTKKLEYIRNLGLKNIITTKASGISLPVSLNLTQKNTPQYYCDVAKKLGFILRYIPELSTEANSYFLLYYNQIPLEKLDIINRLIE